jgi:quinoprotein dehydrogenase-associated probable ABC transporter substrate-binding protein
MCRHVFAYALALTVSSLPALARDMNYLKSKPFDQLTAAELTAAKEEAKKLKVRNLVACADPGNMPLSNDKLEGFQNKIAKVVGEKMGTNISFFWRPYLERGLTRDTFDNNECQVLVDLPVDYTGILTTTPIYRSTYVFAFREDSGIEIKDLDDPKLRNLRIGTFQHSALREVLAEHGIKENVDIHLISADADLRPEHQPWRQVQKVVDKELDIAAVWGPFAGWLKKQGAPLVVQPANFMDDKRPLEFSLAWGVQNTDVVLKLKIDLALEEARVEIEQILNDFGVPLVACSQCIVQGTLPSFGVIEHARAKVYQERYLKDSVTKPLTSDATPDQVVTRERLEAWLAEGANVNDELFNAISGGDGERVAFLIAKGADVNRPDGLGHLPLGLAASMRKMHLMEILIKAGAKLDAEDRDAMTAMQHAINANHVPSITLLAAKGADLEKGTASGYTPLELALGEGKFFAAKALIDAGANVSVANSTTKVTPLMVVATLVQPKERLNQISKGPTPLVLAEDIIKRGADVNARSSDGITALMVAAGHNNAPMIGLLLRSGADHALKSAAGKTALDIAVEAQNEAAIGALKFLASARQSQQPVTSQ